ncbi:hypothetical protein Tco_0860067 [Tanacetum coccineum]|uniref:Uncharacterized protein n=1 Tax=Tanacetum coccineum TaxID=301880 RepID=A0ABQ5BDV2_9ASTR
MSRIGMNMIAFKGNVPDVRKKAVALHLLHQSEDPATMILLSKTAAGVAVGSGLDEMRYNFQDTKSHQVIQSRDITFVDSIYGAGSATNSSSLTKPIYKSQVVLVDILKNLAENDSIVAEHGLSSEITQSPGRRSDTSEGTEAPRLRRYEDPAESPGTPVRYSPLANYLLLTENGKSESYSEALSSKESVQWNKAIIKEMVSLEKNQKYSLVRISARKEGITKIVDVQDSWNEEPCSDVHQVGDEREVEVLRSFNWPPSELITDDGVLPERGYSQFNDVSSGYLVSKVS